MIKRIWALILALVLGISGLTACTGKVVTGNGNPQEDVGTVATKDPGTLKMGLSLTAKVTNEKDATNEGSGSAKVDVMAVAVTVDEAGVIRHCSIDQIPAELTFDYKGALTTELNTEFPSKNEMGTEYGMKKASDINKEWDEQAKAFADYVTGRTLEEVGKIPTDEGGKTTEPELLSSVTISVTDFMKGVALAVRNANRQGIK